VLERRASFRGAGSSRLQAETLVPGQADVQESGRAHLWFLCRALFLEILVVGSAAQRGLRPGTEKGVPAGLQGPCGKERLPIPELVAVLGQDVVDELRQDGSLLV
jgi:hypothetical protein